MPELNRQHIRNKLRLGTTIGLLLFLIGVILLGYSVSAIQKSEQTLTNTELTLEELWNYESSFSWWKNAYIKLFLPLTGVFMTLGGIILFSKPLLTVLRPKRVLETFSENVKHSCEKEL